MSIKKWKEEGGIGRRKIELGGRVVEEEMRMVE